MSDPSMHNTNVSETPMGDHEIQPSSERARPAPAARSVSEHRFTLESLEGLHRTVTGIWEELQDQNKTPRPYRQYRDALRSEPPIEMLERLLRAASLGTPAASEPTILILERMLGTVARNFVRQQLERSRAMEYSARAFYLLKCHLETDMQLERGINEMLYE